VQTDELDDRPLWLSEHYWPDLDDASALALASRARAVRGPVRWLSTLLVPGQRTAFALFAGHTAAEVEQALRATGARSDRLERVLRLAAADPSCALGTRKRDLS
jgi:hypothetical protein